jgi:hypothetical protein
MLAPGHCKDLHAFCCLSCASLASLEPAQVCSLGGVLCVFGAASVAVLACMNRLLLKR